MMRGLLSAIADYPGSFVLLSVVVVAVLASIANIAKSARGR